jgi:predicted DNA-binding transcriptional regulator AlpA
MSTDEFQSELPMKTTNPKHGVSMSRWVNEAYPPWQEILSRHDVARLTRRHRWVLSAMAVLRRFPRKRKFHGRPVGWHRGDVIRWLANRHSRPTPARRPSTLPLPFPVPEGSLRRHNPDSWHIGGRPVRRRRVRSIKRTTPHPVASARDQGTGMRRP